MSLAPPVEGSLSPQVRMSTKRNTDTQNTPVVAPRAPRRFFARAFALLLLCVLSFPAPASAHAKLVSSDPAPGATLDASPAAITIVFNEPVRPLRTRFDLRSAAATVQAEASVEGATLTLTPAASLAEGSWVLLWEVESVDGHPVADVLRFSVGTASATPPPSPSNESVWQDRALEGTAWFAAAFALAALLIADVRRARRVAALLSFCVALRMLDVLDRSGSAAFALGEFRSSAVLLLAAAVPWLPRRFFALQPVLFVGFFAAQGWFSGHHRVFAPTWLMLLAHPLHLAAALLWAAALLALWFRSEDASLLRRASRLATFAVFALLPSVAVLAFTMLAPAPSWGRWEWTVVVKAALTALALLLGGWNHVVLRRNQVIAASQVRRVRIRVAVELLLLLFVAVASASIASSTPTARPEGEVAAPAPAPASLELALVFDDTSRGRLVFDALAPGERVSAMLYLTDPSGVKLFPVSASWELSSSSLALAGLAGEFMPMGDHLHGFLTIPSAGSYDVKVVAMLDEFLSVAAVASFTVPDDAYPSTGAAGPVNAATNAVPRTDTSTDTSTNTSTNTNMNNDPVGGS